MDNPVALRNEGELGSVGVVRVLSDKPRAETARPRLRERLMQDQFALFVLAAAGMLLATPRVLVLGQYFVVRALGEPVARPDLSAFPSVPPAYLFGVAGALATFFLKPRHRMLALAAMVVPLAFLWTRLDVRSIVPVTIFMSAAYLVIRAPISRVKAALLMIPLSFAALYACVTFFPQSAAVSLMGGWAMLVPMLWYSAYEHGRRPLRMNRFVGYMSARLFSAPVFTYGELFSAASGPDLVATRWAGVRTIYVALLASFCVAAAKQLTIVSPPDDHHGPALLAISYVQYLGAYCDIVIRFNLVIGILRLFGIRVRSNFGNWLLARTPNEHWQRWNMLFREWVLTFVFFPVMRARRWLFAAIMAALLTSGLLHIVPMGLTRDVSAPQLTAHLLYWVFNGLAIYAVLKIPQMYPRLVERTGLRIRFAWSVIGVLLTSAFYAVLHGFRAESDSWADLIDYGRRLTTFGPY